MQDGVGAGHGDGGQEGEHPGGVRAVDSALDGGGEGVLGDAVFGESDESHSGLGRGSQSSSGHLDGGGEGVSGVGLEDDGHGDEGRDGEHGAGPVPGQGAIFMAADNHVLDDAHHVPVWVKLSPFFAMLIGFAFAFQFYIRRPDLVEKLDLSDEQRELLAAYLEENDNTKPADVPAGESK